MIKKEAFILNNKNGPISYDYVFIKTKTKKPLVIFCHGFKGFKDWGAWNLVAKNIAENDLVFLKFNFSHNGTTPKNLVDFENLEAFSENNYSKELEDLATVIDFIENENTLANEIDFNQINLIGHSRGGGAVLVKAFEDERVQKVATWAAIDSYNRFGTNEQIAQWKKDGEHVFVNGRTGQKMPIKYQFYKDFIQNRNRLNIKKAVAQLEKPLLVVHGTEDPAVHFESAENIVSWSKNAKLLPIENANHVFGASHPFLEERLPEHLQKVVDETITFFKD